MAIEDVVVDFYGGTTPASVSGKTINSFAGSPSNTISAGTLSSDLSGYDTGASTSISFEMDAAKIESTGGRAAGATTLIEEVNTEGAYNNGGSSGTTYTDTFTVPAAVNSCDVIVFLCTTFSAQNDIDVDVNGTTQTAHDSTNNTSGTVLTFTGVVPNGSNQIVIGVTNQAGQYTLANGYQLTNIDDSSGTTIAGNLESSALTTFSGTVSSDRTVSGALESHALTTYAAAVSSGNSVSGNLESLALTTFSSTISSDRAISGAVESAALTTFGATINSQNTAVPDTFDGTGALGDHWSVYNATPHDAARVGGYFEAEVNSTSSTWFNTNRGRMDYQQVNFPTGAIPNEYIFINIGIGPTSDPRDDHTYVSNAYNFCGVAVHDANTANNDYMFTVVGHRGTFAQNTTEIKSTVSGVSYATDENTDLFGTGVTHADIGVELHSDGTVLFKRRPTGTTTWTYINSGTGLTPSPRPSLGSAGDAVLIGIVAYCSGTVGLPFVGSCDAFLAFEQEFKLEQSALTTYTGTVSGDQVVPGALESSALTTYAATISSGSNISGNLESSALTTYLSSISLDNAIAGAIESAGLTTYSETISSDRAISGSLEAAALTTLTASVDIANDITGALSSVALTTYQGAVVGEYVDSGIKGAVYACVTDVIFEATQ